jgi:energy-coupling factor transporter ATP-binding protein EcfA2
MNRASSSSDVARIPAAPLIEVTGLSKRYGDQIAIKDVSFVASAGEIVGIIGPNGAGKTTLLETLAGLIPADSGVLSGEHVAAIRSFMSPTACVHIKTISPQTFYRFLPESIGSLPNRSAILSRHWAWSRFSASACPRSRKDSTGACCWRWACSHRIRFS